MSSLLTMFHEKGAARRAMSLVMAIAMVSACLPNPAFAQDPGAPGAIRGSLVDANGQPMAGYRVKVTDSAGMIYQSEPTGADGKFEIGGLPAETYSYEIVDPEGKTVAVKIPAVTLAAGTVVTQPIAIVPRKGKKKGPLIAWLVGGGVAVTALALAGGNSSDNGNDNQSSSSRVNAGKAP
jgi:carboxypeptidase family protein